MSIGFAECGDGSQRREIEIEREISAEAPVFHVPDRVDQRGVVVPGPSCEPLAGYQRGARHGGQRHECARVEIAIVAREDELGVVVRFDQQFGADGQIVIDAVYVAAGRPIDAPSLTLMAVTSGDIDRDRIRNRQAGIG